MNFTWVGTFKVLKTVPLCSKSWGVAIITIITFWTCMLVNIGHFVLHRRISNICQLFLIKQIWNFMLNFHSIQKLCNHCHFSNLPLFSAYLLASVVFRLSVRRGAISSGGSEFWKWVVFAIVIKKKERKTLKFENIYSIVWSSVHI